MSKQDIEKRLGFAAQGVKVEMAAPKNAIQLPVNASEYAALVANDALNRTILGDSLYQITNQDRAIRAAGKAAAKSALARHDAWDKAWRNAPNDAARARVEAEAKKAESGMRKYLIDLYILRASRPGVKAKMALTISTVGAKNLCYEALANLKALAQLASETNSGWDFHVTVMTDHVKNAMSQLESSPAQAGRYLERAIDTLGMLKKIEPVRLNDIQKGSFKQLIGYVAKSLRDARANIKVVTTASRPGAKAKMSKATDALAFIKSSIESGRTVYIQTPRGGTKVSPKTYAAWEASGRPLFKIGKDGALLMASGSSYNRLTMGEDEMLVRVSAMSRPGAKAKFEKEYVLWGLPKGETDRLHEKVLSTQAKTPAQMEDVKKRASAAGWHSFRVQILDLSKPYKGFARPGVKAKMAALYSIEVVNGGSVTSTMDPEQFRAWAVKNVPGISQSDFVPTIIEKFNQMAKEKGMGTRVRIGNKRPGAKAKA